MAKIKKRPLLPKSTKINGERWRVIQSTDTELDNEEVEGICHYDTRTIEVNVASDDEYMILSNYFHEVSHALIHSAGVEMDGKLEHALIATFERWLAANVSLRPRALQPKPAASVAAKAKRRRK